MKRSGTRLALLLTLATSAAFTREAKATLRTPQVAVLGGSLQAYLDGQGEHISVLTDQSANQLFRTTVSNNSTFTFQLELGIDAGGNAVGLYDANVTDPTSYPVFPAEAVAGWFAVVSFRSSPPRVVVSLFDVNGAFLGQHTYPGGDRNAFAFYLQGANGSLYTQDARNPGGDPQALVFAGTGVNSGSWWLSWEDMPLGAGSDRDFDDCVLFLESSSCLTDCTEVLRTTWGQVKAHYH